MADYILPLPEDVDLVLARALWPDASAEDIAALQGWIGDDPERASLVARVRGMQAKLPGRVPLHRADAAWDRMRDRMVLTTPVTEREGHTRPALRRVKESQHGSLLRVGWYVFLGVAASVLMVLAGHGISRSRPPRTAMTTYTTRNGERADVTLPDGSRVILNVASRLQVPVDFAAGNRTVNLTGEALFIVTHRSGGPFTVSAGGTTARVLGTSFVVRHYAADSSVTVAVRDGRVAVRGVAIAAREQMDVSPAGEMHLRAADSTKFTFERGVLTLNWVSLADAIVQLDRWYDVDIRLGDASLSTRHLQASFTDGSLADLSSILSYTLDVRVVRAGRTLTLYAQ